MIKNKLTALLKILMVFILLFSSLSSLIAQEKSSNEIIADGAAKMKVKPDFVAFTLTVERSDTSEKNVLEKLNVEVENLTKTLYKIGFTDNIIKIADYNISSSYNNKNKKIYTASNVLNLDFFIDTKLINQLYKQIQEAKLNDVDISFNTSLSDSLESRTRKVLVQKALADAKANAENIAKTLDLKIVRVRQVSKYGHDIDNRDRVEMIQFTPPKIEKDEEVNSNTSFDKFQVVDVELDERITIVYEISDK